MERFTGISEDYSSHCPVLCGSAWLWGGYGQFTNRKRLVQVRGRNEVSITTTAGVVKSQHPRLVIPICSNHRILMVQFLYFSLAYPPLCMIEKAQIFRIVYALSPLCLFFCSFASFRAFGLKKFLILRRPPRCKPVQMKTTAKLKKMKIQTIP
jgi:hypothetical protein